MPFKQKVKKVGATIALTPEAWAILQQKATSAGLSKAEYVENLVRRGDSALYDIIIRFLIDYYQNTETGLEKLKKVIEDIETEHKTVRQLLLQIGVSPNQIP